MPPGERRAHRPRKVRKIMKTLQGAQALSPRSNKNSKSSMKERGVWGKLSTICTDVTAKQNTML